MRCLATVLLLAAATCASAADRPNVLVILTDDQGYGDLGCHGNPVLKTPRLDALAKQSLELTHFYVNPVCAPTRASLLTGRYCYRTGVTDTFNGRAMMRPSEVTLAELLRGAGYSTGLFGKWHLGDCFPMRPQDQGFQKVMMHRGGGIGQPSDPPGGNHYQDPFLIRDGVERQFQGYCTDIFTDSAIQFIEEAAENRKPFFAWVAFNAPHAPLEVRDADVQPYRIADLGPSAFPNVGAAIEKPLSIRLLAKLYGMVANVDANVGRLLDALDRLKLAEDTIVIFLSDNGPQEGRYNAGLRGLKGSVYEGGIRVPMFVRWPKRIVAGTADAPAAHIDLLPTVCAACRVGPPNDRRIDGVNLLPSWSGLDKSLDGRTLFFQWHRGDEPELSRGIAVRNSRYKLVQALGRELKWDGKTQWQLFDLQTDPYEQNDIAASKEGVVRDLRGQYERWFADVTAAGFAPSRIVIGHGEDATILTPQDRRVAVGGPGHWELTAERADAYEIRAEFNKEQAGRPHRLILGTTKADFKADAPLKLMVPAGDARLEVWSEAADGSKIGPLRVTITHEDGGASEKGIWFYFATFGALVAAGFGVPIPEELPVIAAGAAAGHASTLIPRGHPRWWIILPICIAGVVISDGCLYMLGRLGGRRLLEVGWVKRWVVKPEKRAKIEDNFHRYGIKILLGARFLPGVRSPIFIIAGVLKMPLIRFMLADGIYAIPGVTIFFFLSFWFTDQFVELYNHVEGQIKVLRPLLILLALAAVGGFIFYAYQRRALVTGDPKEVPILGPKVKPSETDAVPES